MTTLTTDGKTWELRTASAEVLVVPAQDYAEHSTPMLHRTDCRTRPDPDWPRLIDAHVPVALRERTIALLWEVEVEATRERRPREILFCEQCMLQEARVY